VSSGPIRSSTGFTLIELMLALAVVAIVAGIAVPQYGDYMLRARLTAAAGTLKDLRARMEQRYADNRTYAAGAACAIPAFVDDDNAFGFACTTSDAGQRFTWTATGTGRSAGFVYVIDESGVETTTAVRTGWTSETLPVNRFIVRKGG
jgi:type IV pilus assembly protein PilE